MPRDPRTNPRKGDKLAKVTDHRVRTRTVISVKAGIVCYTPKRVERHCTILMWRKWAKDARVPLSYRKAIKSYREQLEKRAKVTPAEIDQMAAEALKHIEGRTRIPDADTRQALAAAQQTISDLTAELENYRSIAEQMGATKAVAEKQARQASQGTNVVYSHEFAYQLLAGPNKRLVIVMPTFDMPGMSTAHAPHVQPSTVEDVECLVIVPRP